MITTKKENRESIAHIHGVVTEQVGDIVVVVFCDVSVVVVVVSGVVGVAPRRTCRIWVVHLSATLLIKLARESLASVYIRIGRRWPALITSIYSRTNGNPS
jgi:hypothetical protein